MPRVAVIGAGMSGICVAAKLKAAGLHDFTVFEKGDDVGGTWRENTYPGLSCDVASRAYCYSFAPNPDWSSVFPPGPEVHAYFRGVAERLGVLPHVRFGTQLTEGRWEDGAWRLTTSDGSEHVADVLVSACGVLHHPVTPPLAGLDTFAGQSFHSARWDHGVDLNGKRVGVIGTGSTGVQITRALGGKARKLSVFQRSPQWIYPMGNWKFSRLTRALHRRFPALSRFAYRGWMAGYEQSFVAATMHDGVARKLMQGACRLHVRLAVRDPELRRKLTPSDQPMCRRLIMGLGYYKAVQRHDVELVTDAVDRVEPAGIRTQDGRLHELDVLVLATGFDAQAYLRPIELVGPTGTRLSEVWSHAPKAYRTIGLPGFPNFFMLMGPHSPVGNVSLVAIAETQADYIVGFVAMLGDGRTQPASPRQDVTDRFNQEMRDELPKTVWTTGCKSWYLDADGIPSLWPWTPAEHRDMLAQPALDEYEPVAG
jgi:cation diffusion facilitator CzcD-associated flavoprotein CzcO